MNDPVHQLSFINNHSSIMKKRHEQKLIILSVGLLIAFSIPIALLFNSEKEVFGYPMILVYLFSVWMVSIMISFVIVKKYDE
ncbi:hypothetical protein [Chryseobacterium sp. GP-SGM7]|uniref:hypothetical protein n=1 Tax=Chryseobacterium sp. GP-SGM7 TaxID=3411323 RepID=UPI003B95F5BB